MDTEEIRPARTSMVTIKKRALLSLILGLMSGLALLTCHLALVDIWHGETDTRLEWCVLRLAFLLVGGFHVLALSTLWGVWQRAEDPAGQSQAGGLGQP